MRKLLLLTIVSCFFYCGCAQKEKDEIDKFITAYASQHKFNGSVLIAKNGAVLLAKGYGYRNAAQKKENDEHSIFQLGSITKQFTTAIILKLQAEQKISVNDKLSKFFPSYPKGDSITIRQLMTHTSGIYSYTNDRTFMENEVSKPTNREKIMAMFQDKPLDFSPGTQWSYSNSAYSLLGYIIEIVKNQPYEKVVRDLIFTPLDMTHSGFDFTHLASPEKTIGYFKLDGKEQITAPIVDSTVSFSAGSIYSTVEDLYKWNEALEKYQILTKEQQEQAYTPVLNHYGYGWGIDSVNGKRRVGHSGGIHGFTTNFVRIPDDDVCIVLLSNASDRELGTMTDGIISILYGKPYETPKERTVISVPEEKLKQYVGEYSIKPDLNVVLNITNGNLVAAPTGQPTTIMYAEKEDFFFIKEDDIQVKFTRNEKKEVDGFILYQNGGEVRCPKIK